MQGLYQAHQVGLLNFGTFNLEHFEYFEKVENGDSTWIVPGNIPYSSLSAPPYQQARKNSFRKGKKSLNHCSRDFAKVSTE